jgi:hypothetical protein
MSSKSGEMVLCADVVEIIFEFLNGDDLLNCEYVCRQWREILLAGTPWRKLFQRQFGDSPLGRQAAKQLGIIESESSGNIATDKYRAVYKFVQEVKHNWRQGKFTKWTHPTAENSTAHHLEVREDYVSWNFDIHEGDRAERSLGCVFVEMKIGSTVVTEIRSFYKFNIRARMGSNLGRRTVKISIREPGIHCAVNVPCVGLARESFYHPFSFNGKHLCCYSRSVSVAHQGRLRVWALDRGNNELTLKHDHIRQDLRNLQVESLDENFVLAVSETGAQIKTLHFFKTTTFERVRVLTVSASSLTKYVRGMLFERRDTGDWGVLDVASGTRFNDLKSPIGAEDQPFVLMGFGGFITLNSSVIVIGWQYRDGMDSDSLFITNFTVFDMEAVKNVGPQLPTHCCCCCFPLYTMRFPLFMSDWDMDETKLAFVGTWGPEIGRCGNRLVIVLNFSASLPAEAEAEAEAEADAEEEKSKEPPEEQASAAAAADPVHEAVNVEMKVFKYPNF